MVGTTGYKWQMKQLDVSSVNAGHLLSVAEPRVVAAESAGGASATDDTWSESEGSERAAAST